MATKFTTLFNDDNPIINKTIFTKYVTKDGIVDSCAIPSEFDNVLYLGTDISYGDVFKVWRDDQLNSKLSKNFYIFFGVKGDEFK